MHALEIKVRSAPPGSTERLTGSFILVRKGPSFDAHALESLLANYLYSKFTSYEWPRLVSVPGLVRKLVFPDCSSLQGCLPMRPSQIRVRIGEGPTQKAVAPQMPHFIAAKEGRTRIQGKVFIALYAYLPEFADKGGAVYEKLVEALTTVF